MKRLPETQRSRLLQGPKAAAARLTEPLVGASEEPAPGLVLLLAAAASRDDIDPAFGRCFTHDVAVRGLCWLYQ